MKWRGLFFAILKPGGKLLLSVPLNGPLHGEPWHFFQFTHYGVAELAHRAGFKVQEVEKIGALFGSSVNACRMRSTNCSSNTIRDGRRNAVNR